MNIDEMRRREAFDRILCETLSIGWSDLYERRIEVQRSQEPSKGGEEQWLEQPLLNSYYTPEAAPPVRRFVRDGFRWTPVRRRVAPQFLLGTVLATPAALRWFGRSGFQAHPGIPDSAHQVVVPGNQRVRIFDFTTGRVRVLLKSGFDVATMQREIALRTSREAGPFAPILRHACDASWFDEHILDGFPLPRCPPWFSKVRAVKEAFRQLHVWQAGGTEQSSADTWARQLAEALRTASRQLAECYSNFDPNPIHGWAELLEDQASSLGTIEVTHSHGDLQPGNIFIERHSRNVHIIDWEHWGNRFALYDRLVYGLKTRAGLGVAGRFRGFLAARENEFPLDRLPTDSRWRRGALALFLLEDLLWFSREALTGPYLQLPDGLTGYVRELSSLGCRLERLFARHGA